MTRLNLTLTQKHRSSLCGTVVVWYEGINLYPKVALSLIRKTICLKLPTTIRV